MSPVESSNVPVILRLPEIIPPEVDKPPSEIRVGSTWSPVFVPDRLLADTLPPIVILDPSSVIMLSVTVVEVPEPDHFVILLPVPLPVKEDELSTFCQ